MRRRLFDGPDQGLGEALHLIEGVEGHNRDRGCCSLMVGLEVALTVMGQPRSYPQLMGQSGAGFMLKVGPEFDTASARQGREAHVVEALAELGLAARLLVAPEPATVLQESREHAQANRPLLALGWGSNPLEWAVIVGLQGEDLVGHPFGSTGRPQRHPPVVSELLVLDGTTESLSDHAAIGKALTRAVALLQANQSQYATWLSLLGGDEPYGSPLTRLELFSREQWLSACVVDARDAAARFLAERAEAIDDELLAQAADTAGRLAEQAEKLLVPPDAVQRAHLPEDLDWRQQRLAILKIMRDTERDLQDQLRGVLSA